jgi:hypothetical protein
MAMREINRTMLGYNDTNSDGRGGGGLSSSAGGTGKRKSSVTITKPVTKNNNSTKVRNQLGLLTNGKKPTKPPIKKSIIDKLFGGNDDNGGGGVSSGGGGLSSGGGGLSSGGGGLSSGGGGLSSGDDGLSSGDGGLIDVASQAIDLVINVVSDVYVNTPDIREITYPKEVRGADFVGYDVDFDISWNSVHATIIRMYVGNSTDYVELGPKGNLTLNVKELLDKYPLQSQTKPASKSFQRSGGLPPVSMGKAPDTFKDTFSGGIGSPVYSGGGDSTDRFSKMAPIFYGNNNGDKVKIPLRLVPINLATKKPVKGPVEEIDILFDKGDLEIPRSVVINRIAEGFISQFDKCEFDDSKLLTHLLHLGDGDNKVITTWTGLVENPEAKNGNSSLILKLYEPLPTSILTNQKVWISKLQAEPIIDIITLVGSDSDYCPPLQGPNFKLEVDNSIGYQMYDDLVANGSTTSTSLIQKYVTQTGIDTEKLNIQYASGSVHMFENFVHFGSSEERIKNFWYKIQLLESYQTKYNELTTNTVELGFILAEGGGYDGYTIITEASDNLQIDALSLTATSKLQATAQLTKINDLIGTFDGFEKWLYTDTQYSDSLSYPKSGNVIKASSDSESIAWYNSSTTNAAKYDKNNVNYLNNNLPEFIVEDYQNEDFMLFMDMVGQHYDIIWAYVNGLTKLKSPQHKANLGFSNDLMYSMLESLGWDGKKAYDSQYLWEYAFGQYKDGTQKYTQSLKSANEEVWRRILNNLPYILKHKGTSRSLKAVMACYGIPNSLLTIMEFGGPTDPTDGGTQDFTFDDRTAAINFTNNNEFVSSQWKAVDGSYPNAVEMTVNLQTPSNYNILKGANSSFSTPLWRVGITNTTGTFGTIDLYVSESLTGNVQSSSTEPFNIFNEEYTQIVINRTEVGSDSQFQIIAKEAVGDRIRTNISTNVMTITGDNGWDSGSAAIVTLGYEMDGKVDEFRLWKKPLEDSVIETHTLMPDSTVGNSYTSSTEDLLVRFDFEYPKNRAVDVDVKNVAISTEYSVVNGSADGFPSITEYPYQYTPYDRTVTARVPSLGFNSSDKIRFETQTLVGDLSHRVRATKKAFDRAPIDSSRLGLFFSPIKELNMDIIKSFGNFNIDNYIGNPSDEYKDNYSELGVLRDYYFKRVNRDIYEYIRLVRSIDKSLFDVLEDLVPARAKVSKGLLIEPHYLERSKTQWKPASSERSDYETSINVDDNVSAEGDNNQFSAEIDTDSNVVITHQYDNYDASIDGDDTISITSTTPFYNVDITIEDTIVLNGEYPSYVSYIDVPSGAKLSAMVDESTFQQIGMERDSLANAGFGLFAPITTGIVTKLDIFGNLTASREDIYLIKQSYVETILTQTEGYPATSNNEAVKYENVDVTKYKYKVSKLPYGSSVPSVGNDVVEVTPLSGYFPTHYRYKNNLSQGMQNSFFEGSKQTILTTPDGLSPVEVFTTNPNILRVADTGRGSGEPILQVD